MSARTKRYSQQDVTTLGLGLHFIARSKRNKPFSAQRMDPKGRQELQKDVHFRRNSVTVRSNSMTIEIYRHLLNNSGLSRSPQLCVAQLKAVAVSHFQQCVCAFIISFTVWKVLLFLIWKNIRRDYSCVVKCSHSKLWILIRMLNPNSLFCKSLLTVSSFICSYTHVAFLFYSHRFHCFIFLCRCS